MQLSSHGQQAYCYEHGAILVTLLGPIPKKFQNGVGVIGYKLLQITDLSV